MRLTTNGRELTDRERHIYYLGFTLGFAVGGIATLLLANLLAFLI